MILETDRLILRSSENDYGQVIKVSDGKAICIF